MQKYSGSRQFLPLSLIKSAHHSNFLAKIRQNFNMIIIPSRYKQRVKIRQFPPFCYISKMTQDIATMKN